MKQFVFSVFLIVIFLFGSCTSARNNDFSIIDAKNIALNLTSAMQRSMMNAEYYYEGKIRIVSIPGEIVTGIDFENDGIFDQYFFLQTNVDLKINEEIKNGQILYAQTCFIVNNTEQDFIKCFKLGNGNKKAGEVMDRIPANIMNRLNGNSIEGQGIGNQGNTEEYGKYFNGKQLN